MRNIDNFFGSCCVENFSFRAISKPGESLEMKMNRRQWLSHVPALAVGFVLPAFAKEKSRVTPLVKSQSEWKRLLPRNRYLVLFEENTEPPGSSPLNTEKRMGTYICAACNLPLFDSAKKYDSGTGWPSFFEALPDALGTRTDFKLILPRTEYHCARCGGHQGHVFKDGPPPTGLRYCNNGLALEFVPKEQKLPELRT
ncbi:MAG: peptide-methionine (R)-S-oxide reductase MsrB [Methylotetracoccus sp.]|nr:peptide-methionine (R)-S-oxide reductase MsrB [Methylotetracoccus sp.]